MIADDAEHLLEVAGVGSADAKDSICLTCDGVRLSDLWNAAHHFPHPLWWHSSLAVDLDKGLDRPAQRRRLDIGSETPDHTALPEPINPSFGGGCGQPDVMPEHGKALATMVGQPRKDLVIYLVKTQYSLLGFIDHTI
jgi:hypothetical protein